MADFTFKEIPRRETASERYDRLKAEGEPTGWAGYCTVPDYCTSPCIDCGREGRLAEEEDARRRAEKNR